MTKEYGLKNPVFRDILNNIPWINMMRETHYIQQVRSGTEDKTYNHKTLPIGANFAMPTCIQNDERKREHRSSYFTVNVTVPGCEFRVSDPSERLRPSFPMPFTPIDALSLNALMRDARIDLEEAIKRASQSSPFRDEVYLRDANNGTGSGANFELLALVPYISNQSDKWADKTRHAEFISNTGSVTSQIANGHASLMNSMLLKAKLGQHTFCLNELTDKDSSPAGTVVDNRGCFAERAMSLILSYAKMYKDEVKTYNDTPFAIAAICKTRQTTVVIPLELLMECSTQFLPKMTRVVSQMRRTLLGKYYIACDDVFEVSVEGSYIPFQLSHSGDIEPIIYDLITPKDANRKKAVTKAEKEREAIEQFYGEEYGFF